MSEKDKIIPYLSDDEIDKLIADVEGKELVQAPAGIERNVLSFIEFKKRRKTAEFSRYCLRVAFGVAAAVVLMCMVPFIPESDVGVSSREEAISNRNTISREEVIEDSVVKSKEEVLTEHSNINYLEETEIFIQSHIDSIFK